jgi:hypothetical protein
MRPSTRLLAAALFALAPMAAHAVTVSPNALYIDSRTRSGVLTLYNPGSAAEEIDITFAFGYPRSDALGNRLRGARRQRAHRRTVGAGLRARLPTAAAPRAGPATDDTHSHAAAGGSS